jgi:hypothetical protein
MTSFILPGDPIPKKDPYANSDRAYEEAKAARLARKSKDKSLSWEKALHQVKVWTPSMAVEALTRMPIGIQQMYLLAEETSFNRTEVTRFFPAVAPSTREAWADHVGPAVEETPPKKSPAPKRGSKP